MCLVGTKLRSRARVGCSSPIPCAGLGCVGGTIPSVPSYRMQSLDSINLYLQYASGMDRSSRPYVYGMPAEIKCAMLSRERPVSGCVGGNICLLPPNLLSSPLLSSRARAIATITTTLPAPLPPSPTHRIPPQRYPTSHRRRRHDHRYPGPPAPPPLRLRPDPPQPRPLPLKLSSNGS